MKAFYKGLETCEPLQFERGSEVLIYQHTGVGCHETQHCIAKSAAITDLLETTPSTLSNCALV